MVTLTRQKQKVVDQTVLQDLVPLNSLTDARFREISADFKIENIGAGQFLFSAGECDNRSTYLLEGEINFIDANGRVTGRVSAGMEPSLDPLANQHPRLVFVPQRIGRVAGEIQHRSHRSGHVRRVAMAIHVFNVD